MPLFKSRKESNTEDMGDSLYLVVTTDHQTTDGRWVAFNVFRNNDQLGSLRYTPRSGILANAQVGDIYHVVLPLDKPANP